MPFFESGIESSALVACTVFGGEVELLRRTNLTGAVSIQDARRDMTIKQAALPLMACTLMCTAANAQGYVVYSNPVVVSSPYVVPVVPAPVVISQPVFVAPVAAYSYPPPVIIAPAPRVVQTRVWGGPYRTRVLVREYSPYQHAPTYTSYYRSGPAGVVHRRRWR